MDAFIASPVTEKKERYDDVSSRLSFRVWGVYLQPANDRTAGAIYAAASFSRNS